MTAYLAFSNLWNHAQTIGVSDLTELPTLPESANSAGAGMTAVGKVYRDPKTGKLILVSE